MSLVLAGLFLAGGVLLGRWFARGRIKDREKETSPREAAPEGESPTSTDPFLEFPCRLGDVLMRSTGEEAWLAGALLFSESGRPSHPAETAGAPLAALFVAPDAGSDRAVFVRPKPKTEIAWLVPVASRDLTLGREPPTCLEHDGTRFERARRHPLRVQRLGTGAPDFGEEAIVAEYTSSGLDRLLVVSGAGSPRAWRGVALEPGMYDVLPSGSSTLDE